MRYTSCSVAAPCRWAVLFLVTVLVGCEARDRSNPFDPENPNTGGEPPLLNAYAQDGSVALDWELFELEDARRVRLWRASDEGEEDALFDRIASITGSYEDGEVANGQTYQYRLELLAPNDVWLPTSPEVATPGPAQVWVGDGVGGGLAKLTPDGRDMAFRIDPYRDVLDIQFDSDKTPWCVDWSNGFVLHYTRTGAIAGSWRSIGANTLSIDRVNSEIWVGVFSQNTVIRYDRQGTIRWRYDNAGFVEDVSPRLGEDGGCWAASRFTGVLEFDHERLVNRWAEFEWPVAVEEDPRGWVWVIDRVEKVAAQITVADQRIFVSPVSFVDPKDGTLDGAGGYYVADPGRGGVSHLGGNGRELEFFPFGAVDAVTYDPVGEQLWTVVRNERAIKIWDREGNHLSTLAIGGTPVKVEGVWN